MKYVQCGCPSPMWMKESVISGTSTLLLTNRDKTTDSSLPKQ